jgi:hypothetical protein
MPNTIAALPNWITRWQKPCPECRQFLPQIERATFRLVRLDMRIRPQLPENHATCSVSGSRNRRICQPGCHHGTKIANLRSSDVGDVDRSISARHHRAVEWSNDEGPTSLYSCTVRSPNDSDLQPHTTFGPGNRVGAVVYTGKDLPVQRMGSSRDFQFLGLLLR